MMSSSQPGFAPNSYHPAIFPHPETTAALPWSSGRPLLYYDPVFQGVRPATFPFHPRFPECQRQYVDMTRRIARFVEDNVRGVYPSSGEHVIHRVNADFASLILHLGRPEHFGAYIPLVYGEVKAMFHEFENLLDAKTISLEKRICAVITLAPYVHSCTASLRTAVQEALSTLKSDMRARR